MYPEALTSAHPFNTSTLSENSFLNFRFPASFNSDNLSTTLV
uniref:Uncharacterized protein n=2 Tax=Viruses TaxID=10239 RepID=A0A8S5RHX4_9VIRU|nr:MAG TPA: hypothetical protein [virus sp. ctML55]DAF44723.1 MAG TPA: hypothetical protein [Podoviridae sp. ct8Lf7]